MSIPPQVYENAIKPFAEEIQQLKAKIVKMETENATYKANSVEVTCAKHKNVVVKEKNVNCPFCRIADLEHLIYECSICSRCGKGIRRETATLFGECDCPDSPPSRVTARVTGSVVSLDNAHKPIGQLLRKNIVLEDKLAASQARVKELEKQVKEKHILDEMEGFVPLKIEQPAIPAHGQPSPPGGKTPDEIREHTSYTIAKQPAQPAPDTPQDVKPGTRIKCRCGSTAFEKSTAMINVFKCLKCSRTMMIYWAFLSGEIEIEFCSLRDNADPKWKKPSV